METNSVDKPREFTKLLIASFISQSGSYFMTLSLASAIYALTGSVVKAAILMVFSFLPAIFLSSRAGGYIDRKLDVRMLFLFEVTSAIMSILCGVFIYFEQYVFLLIALSIRSILNFASRAAFSKWLKTISPDEKQGVRNKIFIFSSLLATAMAGILAGLTLSEKTHESIIYVVIIDVATYMISMFVILSFESLSQTSTEVQTAGKEENVDMLVGFSNTLSQIMREPGLRKYFLIVIFSQGIFQGAYQALIPIIPKQFDVETRGVWIFQVAVSTGLIIAFLLLRILPDYLKDKDGAFHLKTTFISIAATVSIIAVALSFNVTTGVLSLGISMLFYEIIWLVNKNDFFVESPRSVVARYQFLLDSVGLIMLSICTMGYAVCIDKLGFRVGILCFLGFSLLTIGFFVIILNFRPKKIVF